MTASVIDWAGVRQALQDSDFRGGVAAEMESGDVEYWKQVGEEIDDFLLKDQWKRNVLTSHG